MRWPLRLLFDRLSGPSSRNASHATSRFLAATISAWFSLEILSYRAMAKSNQKDSQQAIQQQDIANGTGLTLQTAKIPSLKVSQLPPPTLAGKTIDITLLAVTRAIDSIVVNLYRGSHSSFAHTAAASSSLRVMSRYADTFIFALSSGTVVRLQFRVLPNLYLNLTFEKLTESTSGVCTGGIESPGCRTKASDDTPAQKVARTITRRNAPMCLQIWGRLALATLTKSLKIT